MTTSDLDYFAGLADVIGCALCQPGNRAIARPSASNWTPSRIENFVARIAAATLSVHRQGLPGTCHCWQFEHAWAFCSVGAADSVLVLVAQANPQNAIQLRAAAESFANSAAQG